MPKVQAGGALTPHKHIYILRPEDDELYNLLLEGEYANVLTSRQTGKTSLVYSTIYRLRDRGLRTAYVELAGIGTPGRVDDYYQGLLNKIGRELKLNVDVMDFWQRLGETRNQRLMRFFRVVCEASDAPAVIFLDEIDSTLKFDFTDDLFAALRAMYNERALVSAYERISFCLVGVATPNELIKDRRTTPYNVGRTLELRDFDAARDQLAPLAAALSAEPDNGKAMLARVLHWTDGHPYLTMHVVRSMIERDAKRADDIDRLLNKAFQTLDRVSNEVHFETILRFIDTRLSHGADSLSLYQRVLEGEEERDTPNLAHAQLKLSGLVKRNRDGFLIVRNSIYARLFDRRWVEAARSRLTRRVAELETQRRQLETQRRERELLAALGVTIAADEEKSGNAVKFLLPITQEKFAEAVPLLRAAAPVVSLDFEGTEVSDISALADLAQLQALDLRGTQVSDISALADLAQLQSLNLRETQVSDISALVGLAQLQSLNLRETQVSDISALVGLAQLQSLNLRETQVSDNSALAGLAQLQELDLGGTGVSDISALAGQTQLRSLTFNGTRVSDISALAGLAQLQELDLGRTPVSDISALAGLTRLRLLTFQGTRVSDISALAGLAQLQSLDLGGTGVSDISALVGLPQLQWLNCQRSRLGPADVELLNRERIRLGLAEVQSLTLQDLQRRHEDLYKNIIRERDYLASNAPARDRKVQEIEKILADVQRQAVETNENKNLATALSEYYWLLEANKIWQHVLSDIIRVPRIVDRLPELALKWSAPATLTTNDIEGRITDLATARYFWRVTEDKDAEIIALRNRPSISPPDVEREDWFAGTVYFAADLLNGAIHNYFLAEASDKDVWARLEDVWVRDVINLNAYERWKEHGHPWQEKEEERRREYLDACHAFRQRLECTKIKSRSQQAVDRLCEYVRDRFLDEKGEDINRTKVERLVRAKAYRSWWISRNEMDKDNWYHADRYVKRFYSNVYNALKWNDQNARNALFKAYQISEGPEYYSSIANCFEAAVLMYFVRGQPKLAKGEQSRETDVKIPEPDAARCSICKGRCLFE